MVNSFLQTLRYSIVAVGLILNLLFLPTASFAAPYGPDGIIVDYPQPDGSKLAVRVLGDEYYAVEETLDGYTITKDPISKVWCYATPSNDKTRFISTGIAANNAQAKSDEAQRLVPGLTKHHRLSPETVAASIKKMQTKLCSDNKGRPLPPSSIDPRSGLPSYALPPSFAPPATTTLGDKVGLCILVDFSDEVGTITPAQVDAHLNQPTGYTAFNNACSVNEYFKIQSNGKLNYTNIVTAYVRVPHPKTYYDDGVDGTWGNSKAQDLVNDALDGLIAQNFDFTRLSLNINRDISSLNIYYAGTCASGWSTGLWPHKWAIPTKTIDPVNDIKAYTYQMTDMKNSLTIGTVCHENGHMTCAYPDLYSYNGNPAKVNSYSLMASSGGTHPPNIDPYLKIHSGWANVIDLTSASHQTCSVEVGKNTFYRFRNPNNAREYFLIENRNPTSGYEAAYGGATALSGSLDSGLIVYHALETGSNTYSTLTNNPATANYTTPYELMVIEANRWTTADWWLTPNPRASSGFESTGFTSVDSTNYGLKFWPSSRTTDSNITLHSISASGPTMTFIAGAGPIVGSPTIGLTSAALAPACDYHTNAASQTFGLFNVGGGTLNYNISDNVAWLSCSAANGTATTESDLITITYDTSLLAPGSHNGTITISDPAATNNFQTIAVTLTVAAQPTIWKSTATLTQSLVSGTNIQQSFQLRNTGGGSLAYTLSDNASWLTLSQTSGTVSTETDTIYVTINATGLTGNIYNGIITINGTNATNTPQTIAVTLTVTGSDLILSTPNGGETWQRDTANNITWTSSTAVTGNIKIELLKGGTLDSTIAASAPNSGSYSWTIPAAQTVASDYQIRLTSVNQPTIISTGNTNFSIARKQVSLYSTDMSANPNWTLGTGWAYGTPTGANEDGKGNPDPTSGKTGSNVIGYNLSGDYEANIAATRYATTPTINCQNATGVTLSFQRWLGVESSTFDHAYIDVSNNGTSWTSVFANSTTTINDSAWQLMTYDISPVADNQATVYIRWGMGRTDSTDNYCGWNIDDVSVFGFASGSSTPTVTTTSASSIATTTASSGGNVTSDGGASVTARGVCWSTTANPTTANSKTTDGSGTGSFASSITGLTAGTTYHVRAYATNSAGTAYGSDLTFTTSAKTTPTITWNNPADIVYGTLLSATQLNASASVPGSLAYSQLPGTKLNAGSNQALSVTFTPTDTNTYNTASKTVYINVTRKALSVTGMTANNKVYDGNTTATLTGTAALSGVVGTDQVTLGGTPSAAFASATVGTGKTVTVTGYTISGTASGNYSLTQPSLTANITAAMPTVTTTSASSIATTTASSGGNVTSDGGASVTARGVCWSTTANPTTANSKTTDGSGTGSFASSITGLTAGTIYHVRAYATNSAGTAYGNDLTFTTISSIEFDHNGHHYKLVPILKNWKDAKDAAAATIHNGKIGYLAVIESATENAAIFARLNPSTNPDVNTAMTPFSSFAHPDSGARAIWLGGSDTSASIDSASEGNFFWLSTGTTAIHQFWANGQNGAAITNRYANFGRTMLLEPDNAPPGQHHVGMQLDGWPGGAPANTQCPAGKWNDLNGTVPQAYLIEYGDTFTLTYTAGANGSLSGSTSQIVNSGTSGTEVTAVPVPGYHFVKWSDDSTANPRTDTGVTSDVTISATFAIDTYTVNFDKQGGTAGTSTVTATYGAAMPTATAPTRTGHSFGGYYASANGAGTQYYYTTMGSVTNWNLSGTTTLFAKWTANIYTVNFDKQSGTGGTSTVTATYGAAMPVATAPTRTGYTFGGYYASANGAGTQYYSPTMTSTTNWNFTATTTLFAKWTANPATAGFTLSSITGPTTEAGGTATFTVKLNTQPTANVTVGLTSNDTTEGTVSPASLTFTTANWNTAQTVTVRGVDDSIVDGAIAYNIITAAATSTDANYNSLNPADVSVTNTDNDTAGFTLSAITGPTTEAGGTATFTVKLNTQPTANVTVGLTSNDTTEGTVSPASLTFTTANWNTAQTVTVTGVNDSIIDGPINYNIVTAAATSTDANYSGLNSADIAVTNTDNDTAGFTLSAITGPTTEAGGTATFTVKLNTQPTANVTVGFTSNDTTEGTVSPASLTFTSANWNTAQTVTVTGVNDTIIDGPINYNIVTAAAVSTDTNYSGLNSADVAVTNTDNDTAGFTLSAITGPTTEIGGTATFTVKLNTQPTANVTIGLTSSDLTEGTVSPASLTFTTANWNTAQTVTVRGVNDSIVDGAIAYNIVTAAATSTDATYNGRNPADVSVTNNDDDVIGFSFDTRELNIQENGGTGTFQVSINAIPINPVIFDVSSSAPGEATVSPAQITFTSGNWNTAQPITVTGINDTQVALGSAIVKVTPNSGSDSEWLSLSPQTVQVTCINDDPGNSPGILVAPLNPTIMENTTGSAQIALATQPDSNVTIDLTVVSGKLTASPSSLTFTSTNWATPKNVTLTPVDDTISAGNSVAMISAKVSPATLSAAYKKVAAKTIKVNIIEDDPLALPDFAAVGVGDSVVIDLLENDLDPNGDLLRYQITANPASGSLVNNGDGTVTYTAPNTPQTVTFQCQINDQDGDWTTAPAPVDVTIDVGDYLSAGMVVSIAANSVNSGITQFVSKPSIYATFHDPVKDPNRLKTKRKVTLPVITPFIKGQPLPTTVEAELASVIRLYKPADLLKHYAKCGTVANFTQKRNAMALELHCKTLIGGKLVDSLTGRYPILSTPVISKVTNRAGEDIDGVVHPGSILQLEGKYFGKTAPRAWIEYSYLGKTRKLSCKVIKPLIYDDSRSTLLKPIRGKSCTDHDSGDSLLLVQLPTTWPSIIAIDNQTYQLILDNGVGLASTPITVNAQSAGQGPIAEDDFITIAPSKSVLVDVLANDDDPEGDELIITSLITDAPELGTASISGNKIKFTAKSLTAIGEDKLPAEVQITYHVKEKYGPATSTATLTVEIDTTSP